MNATKVFSVIIMALSTSLTMGCVGAESDDVDESEAALVAAEGSLASRWPAPARVAIQVRPSSPSHAMPGPDDDDEPGPPRVGSLEPVAIQAQASSPSHAMPGPDDDDEPGPPRVGTPRGGSLHGPGAGFEGDEDCGPVPHVGPGHDEVATGR